MTTTLQQALINAGLVNKNRLPEKKPVQKTLLKPKSEVKPHFPPKQNPVSHSAPLHEKKHEHHLRTDCEACKRSGPDVEYYEHTNRSVDVHWLCVKCADTYNISDQCRQTKQSQFSKSGRFRREYGATKVF